MMSLIGIGNQLGFNQQAQQQQPHDDYDDVFSLGGASTGGRHQRKMKLTRSGISLSMDQKSHLIDHIHERPQIWDNNCEGFRSNQTRQNAFNEVAQLLSDASETYTRIQVQEEWGKLRYCFTRIVKKLLEEGNGQINEAQQAAVTWPYWGRMLFLLDGVKQQLQGISTDGDGVQHQENKNSSGESSPTRNFLPPRTRRRRANTSRKSSHDYQEDLSQSPTNNNDLLVSRALGMTPQELVMAKMAAAFNTSHQMLNQMKHEENTNGVVEPMNAENAAIETFNDNIINQANVMAQQQQQLLDVSQQQNGLKDDQQPAENTASVMAKLVAVALNQGQGQQRRKRKRSNLDFLLPKSIQREEQQPAATTSSKPIVYQTPAKNASDSIFSVSNRSQQPQMPSSGSPQNNETEVTEAEGGGIDKNGFGAEEVAGEDINESFGRYMINQLQTVAKKNPMLCVQMRKELMEVCFKFEMRACKVPQEEDG